MSDEDIFDDPLAAIRKEFEVIRDFYKSVESLPLPASIKEAIETGWTMAEADSLLQLGAILKYDPEQQKEDRKRVVPLKKVMRLLSEFEVDMVKEFVVSPGDVIEGELKRQGLAWVRLANGVKEFLWGMWKNRQLIQQFWRLILAYWKEILATLAVADFGKRVLVGVKVRKTCEQRIRGAALAQRIGPRYQRRKVTRR